MNLKLCTAVLKSDDYTFVEKEGKKKRKERRSGITDKICLITLDYFVTALLLIESN